VEEKFYGSSCGEENEKLTKICENLNEPVQDNLLEKVYGKCERKNVIQIL